MTNGFFKKLASFLLVISLFVMTTGSVWGMWDYVTIQGKCGENVTFKLDLEDGLGIEGTGDMYDWEAHGSPWTKDLIDEEEGFTENYTNEVGKVTIGEGVTSIGNYAFYGCFNCKRVSIPTTITRIGENAFYMCVMTGITLPEGLESIGDDAFRSCEKLTSIELPQSLTALGAGAFRNCTALTTITVPEKVTKIGEDTFRDCSGLNSITFPKGVTEVGACAFENCTALTDVYFGGSKADWNKINVHDKNESLLNAEIHYAETTESISEAEVEAIPDQTYTGSAISPAVTVKLGGATLVKGTDYTVSYKNNVNVGTATVTITGKGDYTGTKTATFKIKAASISGAEISAIEDQTYTGEAITPEVTVTLGAKTLTKDTDYTVAYSDNTNAGTATVTITGKGNYTGTKTASFTILAKPLSGAKVSGIKTKTYTGKALKQSPKVELDGTTLVNDTDYKLSYKKNKAAGKATVTIEGIGNYTGTISKNFYIKPAKTGLSSVKNSAKGTVTVKWAKAESGTGYKIQYGTKKSLSGAKTVTVKKLKTVSKKIKKLTKGKTYYFRIRVYKKVGSKILYSKWSAKKKVKIKK